MRLDVRKKVYKTLSKEEPEEEEEEEDDKIKLE
jgi:hypothetical protein